MSLVTCGRELGGGDSPWETGSGCELVVVIIVDNHQLDHIRIAIIISTVRCSYNSCIQRSILPTYSFECSIPFNGDLKHSKIVRVL